VVPVFGDGVLAFHGSPGAVASLYTRQLDLSQTIDPQLIFWYFHDTLPGQDYIDVRITIDGGATFTSLITVEKQGAARGWKEYGISLPSFALNQCVFIVFEAMEWDRNGAVFQYIDRILIKARRDLAVTKIQTSELIGCDFQNKQWKVVVSNLTNPVVNFASTPITITLELTGKTNQTFTDTIRTGILNGFSSDTFVLAPNFDFAVGTYHAKASIISVEEDINHANNTLSETISLAPVVKIEAVPVTDFYNMVGCIPFDTEVEQIVKITNRGNLPMSNIPLAWAIYGRAPMPLFSFTDTLRGILPVGSSVSYSLSDRYIVPKEEEYNLRMTAEMDCLAMDTNTVSVIIECVDMDTVPDDIIDYQSIVFALGQNTPNPAQTNTRIEYTLPEDGQITFTVYAVTGQILFEEKQDSYSGKSHINFNTNDLANGIYYYSLEYKGERLVRKMTIQR
jgi:hypothetical protein